MRWDARLVWLFNYRFEQIALHVWREPGRFSTISEHFVAEKINGLERGAAWLLRNVESAGDNSHQWGRRCCAPAASKERALHGLLALAVKHPAEALEHA